MRPETPDTGAAKKTAEQGTETLNTLNTLNNIQADEPHHIFVIMKVNYSVPGWYSEASAVAVTSIPEKSSESAAAPP